MGFSKPSPIAWFKTLLSLGRLSLLPTIWSNCLAAWLLSGEGDPERFGALCLGTTCLYLGGLCLNDACDAQFDAVSRRERPIPAGLVTLQTMLLWSLCWLGTGALILVSLGKTTAILTVLLSACIALYDLVHKLVTFAPILMGTCRFFLYLTAGSAADGGVSGLAVWSGLALACYVAGLCFLERQKTIPALWRCWPCYLLAGPVLLAMVANGSGYRLVATLFSSLLVLWVFWCLRFTFWTAHRNIQHTVAGLWAGIILADLLAMAGGSLGLTGVFLLWFIATLLFQRVIPAT